MKLATLRTGGRDGTLVVVSRDGSRFATCEGIAPTLQHALDHWNTLEEPLRARAAELESGTLEGSPLEVGALHSPLPRAYEWIDGSAYINHIVLVRKARGAEPPETLETDPLVYQGGSGVFLAPTDPIPLPNVEWGLDFEAEICVVLGDTPRGVSKSDAFGHVRLLMLCNDVTLRNLIPAELKKNFGFFNSKPATAFSPFAITPDELGDSLKDGRVHRPLRTMLNGELAGDPHAGPEMHFSFSDLIAHIAKTRSFTAGTILGSGTVSNEDTARGVSCLAERRMREKIDDGEFKTPFLSPGDRVQIEMLDDAGASVFGTIDQTVAEVDR
ncbi:MAG: fumarylacetoacetate hydrolase family protein [Myxococcota bacterium]